MKSKKTEIARNDFEIVSKLCNCLNLLHTIRPSRRIASDVRESIHDSVVFTIQDVIKELGFGPGEEIIDD